MPKTKRAPKRAAAAASPPPPASLVPPPAPLRSGRVAQKRKRYGDGAEATLPPSKWASTPASRKPDVDASVDYGVPAFALPGEEVYASGLRAGFRLRFRATVLRLRAQFPRIVVRYDATEDGNAAKPLLPYVGTAYVTMDQVAPRNW